MKASALYFPFEDRRTKGERIRINLMGVNMVGERSVNVVVNFLVGCWGRQTVVYFMVSKVSVSHPRSKLPMKKL